MIVVGRNFAAQVFTWLGLARLGAVMLPVNPASTADELSGFIEQVQPGLIACDRALDPVVDEAAARSTSPVSVIDVHELLAASPAAAPRPTIDPRDPVVLIPTSGTTGRSKLVTQTHQGYTLAGEGFPAWVGLAPEDRLITALPIFHINAPAYSLLGSMAIGASVVLLERFSPSRFLDAARHHGATEFNMIGAMLEMLMRQPERDDDADNPLRVCYTGPTPPRERQLEIEQRFGIEVVCGYGLSESTYGTFWPRGERPFETLGRGAPAPDARAHQRRPGDGRRRRGRVRGGRRARAAQPRDHARLLRDARGDGRGPRRRLAAHRRPRAPQRGRHVHVRLPEEGSDPAARREPRAERGRGGARRSTPTSSKPRSSRCRPISARTR